MQKMSDVRESLIVALDTDAPRAIELAEALSGDIRWLKVGMTLFYAEGPGMVALLRERGFDIFLDLKLHDIPHQARGAARAVARLGVGMLTVHASGGTEMIAAAVQGAREGAASAGFDPPSVLAVTVLTSMDDSGLKDIGIERPSDEQVAFLARSAVEAGADGVVCSPLEARAIRELLGPDRLIVTPGIRPSWASKGDQARIQTPGAALSAGATHLVVGRPITEAAEPAEAARRIIIEALEEIA
jgi:orotidine-5'-phosphate decarboxylase